MGALLHLIRDRQPLPPAKPQRDPLGQVKPPPSRDIENALVNGASITVAIEWTTDGAACYAVQLGRGWFEVEAVLTRDLIDAINAYFDKPEQPDSEPAEPDYEQLADRACARYEAELDARASW